MNYIYEVPISGSLDNDVRRMRDVYGNVFVPRSK